MLPREGSTWRCSWFPYYLKGNFHNAQSPGCPANEGGYPQTDHRPLAEAPAVSLPATALWTEETGKEEQAGAEKAVTKEAFQGEHTAQLPCSLLLSLQSQMGLKAQRPLCPVSTFLLKHFPPCRPPNGSEPPLRGRQLFSHQLASRMGIRLTENKVSKSYVH